MKTITRYGGPGAKDYTMEFDDEAPCSICREPVGDLSISGPSVCPSCDLGKCRYCGVALMAFKEEIDGGRSLRELREHVASHKGGKVT